MRKIKSENIAEKSNERTVPPGGGPSFRCILLAEQEMLFSDIFFFRNKVRRVDYSTKFLKKPYKSRDVRMLTIILTVNKCCKIYNYD